MINAERAKASFIDTSGMSMASSLRGASGTLVGDDKSILNSIGDMFGSISFGGGVPTGM
jgi:hypothetical protein